jgi:hypothetical protein
MAETSWGANRTRTLVRLLWAAVLAAALALGATSFEQTDSGPRMPTSVSPAFEPLGSVKAQGGESKSQGNHTKHCTDGKGSDDVKNKHCRAMSGQVDE